MRTRHTEFAIDDDSRDSIDVVSNKTFSLVPFLDLHLSIIEQKITLFAISVN